MDRESAISALVDHHSSQDYSPEDYYAWVVNADGRYLGPYIPYIGKSYFTARLRLLIYAMAQNLNRAEGLIKSWLNKPDKGMLRQYNNADIPYVHVYPYDNGHLKVIAALALNSYPGTRYKPTDNVDDLAVITNFVKFSFYREREDGKHMDANPPLETYDEMWQHYCEFEVGLLQPDVIIGVGNDVTAAINRCLAEDMKRTIKVVRVPFPGRLNLNSRWVPKGKEFVKTEGHDPNSDKAEMRALVRGTPDKKGLIQRAIETDWYYFRALKECIIGKLTPIRPE